MTLIEAADLLGTTPDNLRGAIRRGALQATKHGRDWWVDRKEVDRYARENRRGHCGICGRDLTGLVSHEHRMPGGKAR